MLCARPLSKRHGPPACAGLQKPAGAPGRKPRATLSAPPGQPGQVAGRMRLGRRLQDPACSLIYRFAAEWPQEIEMGGSSVAVAAAKDALSYRLQACHAPPAPCALSCFSGPSARILSRAPRPAPCALPCCSGPSARVLSRAGQLGAPSSGNHPACPRALLPSFFQAGQQDCPSAAAPPRAACAGARQRQCQVLGGAHSRGAGGRGSLVPGRLPG